MFQLTFAAITPALIVGAFSERMRFGPLLGFTDADRRLPVVGGLARLQCRFRGRWPGWRRNGVCTASLRCWARFPARSPDWWRSPPASGSCGPLGALAIGATAGVLYFLASSRLKRRLGYDDALDVFGVHGVGGLVGALLTGVFTSASLGGIGRAEGVSISSQVDHQALAVLVTCAWVPRAKPTAST